MKITLNNQEIELTPNIKLDFLLEQNKNAPWWQDIINFLECWASDSKTIQVKTSGSTGTPKVIDVQKSMLLISASKTCSFFQLNISSTGLLCLSTSYIAGQMMLVRALVSGMNLVCIKPSNNPVVNLDQDIDFAAFVPLQLQNAIKTPEKLNRVKHIIIGGGQVSTSLISDLKMYKGYAYESFGMTETLSHIALKQLTPTLQDNFMLFQGVFISQGFKNDLIINYPELGIYRLKTNDVVDLTIDGGFKWKGRMDFVINSGGVKISPEQVEKQIEHLLDQRICIIGIPDDKLGEKLVLIIEGNAFDTERLKQQLKETLSSYNIPKEIIFMPEFPLTENGKLKRKEISNID